MDLFNRKRLRMMIIVCLLVPVVALADLIVIYDSGKTQPIAPFLEVFESAERIPQQSPKPVEPKLGAADPKTWLPIKSPGLKAGPVQAKLHDRPFARPFFLIGSDTQSWQWLQDHRDRLKEIGAVGMLVQAETLDDLRTAVKLADGISILPASASDIAKALGITHYPVLISAHGIEQ